MRPEQRGPPGTPLPQRFRTPGARTHAAISHPLRAILLLRRWQTMAHLCVWALRCIQARPPTSHVHKSHTLYVALCESLQRLCGGGGHTNVSVQTDDTRPRIHSAFSLFFTYTYTTSVLYYLSIYLSIYHNQYICISTYVIQL